MHKQLAIHVRVYAFVIMMLGAGRWALAVGCCVFEFTLLSLTLDSFSLTPPVHQVQYFRAAGLNYDPSTQADIVVWIRSRRKCVQERMCQASTSLPLGAIQRSRADPHRIVQATRARPKLIVHRQPTVAVVEAAAAPARYNFCRPVLIPGLTSIPTPFPKPLG